MQSTSQPSEGAGKRRARIAALALLGFLVLERVLLALAHPDLLHDLDPGEIRHLDLAVAGLPDGPSFTQRLYTWLSGTENIHHGGFAVLSVVFLLASKIFGTSLFLLRLLGPILATVVAAMCVARVLQRRLGSRATLLMLALFAGAPPLLLKWTCTARGGHLEAIVFPALLLLLLDHALASGRLRMWLLAGLAGGFSVYVSYLAVPAVIILSLGALAEAGRDANTGKRLGFLLLGGCLGFMPWILGLVVLDLPYFEATIHSSANPNEAAEVHGRSMFEALRSGLGALPRNLWPWTIMHADAAAYAASEPDILDYTPTAREWLSRAVINIAALTGIGVALRKRGWLLASFLLLPALHHLFVLRTANQPGWPLIPHRYLVLVFPAIVAAAGYGTAALWSDSRPVVRRLGQVLAGLLLATAAFGAFSHLSWLQIPSLSASSNYRADLYRQANIGQVRLSDAASITALTHPEDPTYQQEIWQGLARVYPPVADYYLLFRQDPQHRPYPGSLFAEDPGDGGPAAPIERKQLEIQVKTAWEATKVRAGEDTKLRDRWLCSWQPSAAFAPIVVATLADEFSVLHCPAESSLSAALNRAAPPPAAADPPEQPLEAEPGPDVSQ